MPKYKIVPEYLPSYYPLDPYKYVIYRKDGWFYRWGFVGTEDTVADAEARIERNKARLKEQAEHLKQKVRFYD